MMFLYRFLIYPILKTCMILSAPFVGKIRKGLRQRKKKNGFPPWKLTAAGQTPVIIHCSSGEFEYAKPVIRELKKAKPSTKIFISYFSPSYVPSIQTETNVDFYFPAPWDDLKTVRDFLDYHKPSVYMISRTDLWPCLLSECKRRGIRVVLFSATLSTKSKRLTNVFSRALTKWTFSFVDKIYCVSKEDLESYKQLGLGSKTEAIGDTRFDQVLYRIQNPRGLRQNLKPSRFSMVLGSTWTQDEDALLSFMKSNKGKIQFILAPHEPSAAHLFEIENKLEIAELTHSRYTKAEKFDTDVLVVDTTGILADLYAWGDFAFVGGSFKKSVHSVMEPLASGCLTFVGPYHHNNREALLFKSLKISNGLAPVQELSEENLSDVIESCKNKFTDAQSDEIKKLVYQNCGASQKLVNLVFNG